MTREEVQTLALSTIDKTKYLILELITGYGKSKVAIDLANHIATRTSNPPSILLLVAKRVHKLTWEEEIQKWGGVKGSITMECYESLKNYVNSSFDIVIADEAQHLSELRLSILKTIRINQAFIGLSATLKRDLKFYFRNTYGASFIKCDLKEAVEDNVLPEPKVYLLPLSLDNTKCVYKVKKFGQELTTTQRGYYKVKTSIIEWYKTKFYNTRSERLKNLWLSAAGQRLKWLSEQKESIVLQLLHLFRDVKTLTFCSSINQAERLGKYNITSKNKESIMNLDLFNCNQIRHITACNILNEGVNLTDCQIGIFCNLNSSEIIVKQRVGRILRHHSPLIIVPYYKDTREEELVQKMIEEYSPESVITINNIKDIIIKT